MYFHKRICKNVTQYFPKPRYYSIIEKKSSIKISKPYNLSLLIKAIQSFIFKNVDLLKPKRALDFLLDGKLKQYLLDNFSVSKR